MEAVSTLCALVPCARSSLLVTFLSDVIGRQGKARTLHETKIGASMGRLFQGASQSQLATEPAANAAHAYWHSVLKDLQRGRKREIAKKVRILSAASFAFRSIRCTALFLHDDLPAVRGSAVLLQEQHYANRSLFCLDNTNSFRGLMIKLIEWPWFDRVILIVILLNCCISVSSQPLLSPHPHLNPHCRSSVFGDAGS